MKIYKGVAVALTAAILASGGGITLSLLTATPAQAASTQPEIDSAIAQILAETNAERAKQGLAPLTLDPKMSKVSQTWSEYMAARKTMYHNPSYTNQLPKPWIRVGENVGQGYTQSTIVAAWMASEGHRQNILGDFTHIGLGFWVDETGRGWFTQNFGKYEQPVLTTLNEPVTTVGKFDIKSTWLAKWDEIPNEYNSELYSPTGALLQSKVTTTPEVTFTGLTDNTAYTVKTTARMYNALGEMFSSPATTYTVTTLEDLPTVTAPTNLTLKAGEESVEATWTASTDVYGTLSPYTVELLKGSTVVKSVQTVDPTFIFSGITSNTDYTVKVTAASTLKGKTATATATATTKTMLSSKAEVSDPKNLVVTADAHSTVKATWAAPDQKIGVGLKYILTLSSAGKPNVRVETTATSYNFTSLRSETPYTVKVQAFIVSENGTTEITTGGVSNSVTTPINYDEVSVSTPALKPVLVEPNKATFGWTAPQNVAGKFVDYTLTVKQQGQADRVFNTTLDYYVVTGLKENTAYTFELKANATSLNGKFFASSVPATATHTTPYSPSTAIVSAPRNLTVSSPAYNQVNASWTAPASVVGTVAGYKATIKSGDIVVKTQTVTGLNTSFTGLEDSAYYTVEVVALATSPDKTNTVSSTAISGSEVTAAHVDAPNAPANFKVDSAAHNEATLSWDTPTGVYGTLTDYTITLKESGKADRVFRSPSNVYKVTGLTENDSYTAQVVANVVSRNGALRETSPLASVAVNTPYSPSTVKVSAPSDLKFSGVTHNALTASWTAPTGIVGSVTGYKVTLKQGATVVETKTVTGLNANFAGLNGNTDYTVEVSALAASADRTQTATSTIISSKALTLTLVAAPNAPTSFKAGSVAFNKAGLSWVAPTGVVGNIVDYTVTVKEAGKADRVLKTAGTSYELTGLVENSDYTVTVVANVVSQDGSKTIASPSSTVVAVSTPYAPTTVKVSAPTALTISGVAYNSMTAHWTAPAGTVGKVISYSVTLKQGDTVKGTYSTTGTSYTLTGLNSNAGYTVEVRALATSANGVTKATSVEADATATTLKSPIVSVTAPTVTLSEIVSGGFKISWTKPTGNGSITGYKVVVKHGSTVVKTVNADEDATSTVVTGLDELADYSVTVEAAAVAENGINTSKATSTVVSATTPRSAASTVAVSAPTALATTVTSGSVNATWKAPVVTGTVVNYTVIVKQNGAVVKTYSTTDTKATISGLKEKTAYTVEVVAHAASSNGLYKATSAAVTKAFTTILSVESTVVVATPSSLALTPINNNIKAMWVQPAATGAIWQYRVILKEGTTEVKKYYVTGNVRELTFSGLKEKAAYTVEIRAYAKSPNGLYSVMSAGTTKAVTTGISLANTVAVSTPSTLAVTPVYDTIKATWTRPAFTGTFYQYRVILKLNGVEVKKVYLKAAAATSYVFTGLKEKTGYTVEIRAYAKSPNGLKEAISSTTTRTVTTGISLANTVAVSTPATLTATATFNSITATWKKPAFTGNLFMYRVILKLNGVEVKKVYPVGTATSYVFTGLKEKTGYTVEIRAYAKSPNGLKEAISSTTKKTVTTTATPVASKVSVNPMAPMVASATSKSAITATWKKPTYTGTLTSYYVTIKQGSKTIKGYSTNSLKASFTGLVANTAYTITVKANVKSANGLYSANTSVTKTVTTKR